jgi:hypothetical protein
MATIDHRHETRLSTSSCLGGTFYHWKSRRAVNPMLEPIELFYSYAHADERFRAELEGHLSVLRRLGLILDWHDRRIDIGDDWKGEIDSALERAQIILLLVSPDYLASDYTYDVEMKRALERHEAGEARVIPVILRPVGWSDTPLGKLQALPKNGRPVSQWRNRDEAFADVVRDIRAVAESFQAERGLRPSGVGDDATFESLSPNASEAPQSPQPPPVRDETGTLLDRPAQEDELGRLSFAHVIALRIRGVRHAYREPGGKDACKRWREVAPGPFIVHLHGAWGSGKSSLLRFVAEELRNPTMAGPDGSDPLPWVVVEFNAWQHQRIAPPWWWLLSGVHLEGVRELWRQSKRRWLVFQLSDLWWRTKHGWPNLVGITIGLAAVGLAAWATWSVFTSSNDFNTGLKALAALASSLAVVIGLGLTILGITRGVRDYLLVRSAAGARDGLAHGHDPLATVKSRFEHVVQALGRPLAVIIDDLDRCQPKFVVELLEGIQTLYGEAPVTYVVAADGRWIRECFEDEYETFKDMPTDVGRPLGYHFLEKTFQLSADVPRLTDRLRHGYFQRLLGVSPPGPDTDAAAATVRTRTASAESEEELRAAVSIARTPQEEAVAIKEALIRAQSAAIRQDTEHRLQNFDALLEPNPRAMKRLVNAYGLARDVELIESGARVATDTDAIEQLALWTILRLRWPLLAQHLERHPNDIDEIGQEKVADKIPERLREVFADPDVVAVVKGRHVNAQLDRVAVNRIVKSSAYIGIGLGDSPDIQGDVGR